MLSKYGVARHVYIPILKRAAADYAVGADWTPAAGDVQISKDGAAAANVTNLPVALTIGNAAVWDFSLTATEMEAAQVVVAVADAATKAIEDDSFSIETYGHASAQHAFDLDSVLPTNFAALAITVGGAVTAGTGDAFARLGAPAGASISADIQARLPAALTAGGNIKADVLGINGDTTAAANIAKTTRAIGRGMVDAGASTTSIPTSAFAPAGGAADQFKGRIVTFDADTTTAALRGQATDITASSNAVAPTLTVTALTNAPVAGDTFSIT